MIWLIRRLTDDVPNWEPSAKLAFALALILLVVTLIVLLVGPAELRQPALYGFIGLVIVTQGIVLWGSRGMTTPLTQAQRRYLDGDFVGARALLEPLVGQPKTDARALTLLGNTYRQLGLLAESRTVLSEALDKAPNHHFPRYGIGRTLLSEGDFAEAADAIQQALDLGAPEPVRADLGEALYYAGQFDQARAALLSVQPMLTEPHRRLMTEHLLARLGAGDAPQPELVRAGLPYWSAAAERFRHTPYGQALEVELLELHTLLKES